MNISDYGKIFKLLSQAEERLNSLGYTGIPPRPNFHHDKDLPACLYQPRTNSLAICISKISVMLDSEVSTCILDAMAVCGCYRDYQASMREWNHSQNKARLPAPALAMQGGPKWRSIRSKL